MRAVIMAGGKGTRLRPYTTLIPKPLVPLGGKYSVIEMVILQLKNQGFTHITLTVNHLSNLIISYFGDGERLGIKIDYSLEETELSTIGPLTLIDDLPENFLVMNGDVLCDLDFAGFLNNHIETKSLISVSSYKRETKIDFGVLKSNGEGKLTEFVEKPEYNFDVSMGVYCLNLGVVKTLERGAKYGLDDLLLDSLKLKRDVSIRPFDGFWLDIGRPDDYDSANENFEDLASKMGVPV